MMHLLLIHLAHWLPVALPWPLLGLSLLGGGGGLGISGQSSTSTAATSGAPVTVYNATSGLLWQSTWLILGAVALGAVFIFALIFRSHGNAA
jgi:hypothetical protein